MNSKLLELYGEAVFVRASARKSIIRRSAARIGYTAHVVASNLWRHEKHCVVRYETA